MSITDFDIGGHESNTHFLRSHYQRVSEILAQVGIQNDLMAMLKPPANRAGVPAESGISPDFSKPIDDLLNHNNLPFELESQIEGCYGGGKGSANTTTVFEKTGMALETAFKILADTGQLESALSIIRELRAETDPSAEDILAYMMATLSKGWMAEKVLNSQDRWTTGSVSQDQGGLDLYDRELGEMVQLKPVTSVARNGPGKYQNKEAKHLFYFWTGDGKLAVTEAANWTEAKNRESERTGIPGTLLIKTEQLKSVDLDRRARFLWW